MADAILKTISTKQNCKFQKAIANCNVNLQNILFSADFTYFVCLAIGLILRPWLAFVRMVVGINLSRSRALDYTRLLWICQLCSQYAEIPIYEQNMWEMLSCKLET